MSDLESYVTNKVINGHCDCMFLVNTYQWEWTTIAALIAPRPLLFANRDNDTIFPMDGNRRIIERLRQVLRDVRQAGQLSTTTSAKGGHDYRPDLRAGDLQLHQQAPQGRRRRRSKDADFPKIDGQGAARLPRGQGPAEGRDQRQGRRDVRAEGEGGAARRPKEFKEWKAGLVKQLREKSFRALPEKCRRQDRLTRQATAIASRRPTTAN